LRPALRRGWERTYTRDEWLDQLPTHGHLTLLPPDKLATVLESVGNAIDATGGSLTMSYTTVAVTASRTREGRSTCASRSSAPE
jgi:hypothetical protein